MPPLRFKNPANGYIVQIDSPELWSFLFGPLYFAAKGVWKVLAICFIAAVLTLGISIIVQIFVLPIFSREIFEKHFLMLGWTDVTDEPAGRVSTKPAAQAPPQRQAPVKSLFSTKQTGIGVGEDGIPTYKL